VDGVLARGQRPQQEIIPGIDAGAQEQFWNNVFAHTNDVVFGQLDIKAGRLFKILQGIVDCDVIDFRRQYDVIACHLCAEELFRPCLWRVVQERPVEGIHEWEEQGVPVGTLHDRSIVSFPKVPASNHTRPLWPSTQCAPVVSRSGLTLAIVSRARCHRLFDAHA